MLSSIIEILFTSFLIIFIPLSLHLGFALIVGEALGGQGKDCDMPYEVGEAYFFRTVTYHAIGRVKNIIGDVLVLEEASWVADSGRLNEFVNDGKVYESSTCEIEPINVKMFLHKSAICDAFEWKHKLPNKVK